MFHLLLVCYDPGLFEAIHALLYAYVYPPLVGNQCLEVVNIDNVLWDGGYRLHS